MGGYGSGRHSGRPTVEGSLRLELPRLKASNYFIRGEYRTGTWSWSRGGEPSGCISLAIDLRNDAHAMMILDYKHNGEPIRQDIRLVAVPMRFGGVRWWALCPVRWRRCGTLVFCARYRQFVSVKAAGIGYASQASDPLDRVRRRAEKLERRYNGLSKYTRTGTRTRLREQWMDYEYRADELFTILVGRLAGKVAAYDATIERLSGSKRRKGG